MPKQLTDVSQQVLPPALSREQVNEIESKAVNLYGQAQRTSLQFAAELRKLQDGQAHIARGYSNFGLYVERTFEGIGAGNAQQISRTGHVLLVLEAANRINIYTESKTLPGVTGVRSLATLLGQFGEDAMIAVYDKAAEMAEGSAVLDRHVKAATQEVIEIKPAELGEGVEEPDEPEDELDDDDTEQLHELYDRFGILHDMLTNMADKIAEGRDIVADIDALRDECELLRKEATGETDAQWLETGR